MEKRTDQTLLLTLPNVLDAKEKARLAKRGLIVVETPDLNAAKLIYPTPLLATDQWIMAALETLGDYASYKEKFAERILKAMKKNAGVEVGEREG